MEIYFICGIQNAAGENISFTSKPFSNKEKAESYLKQLSEIFEAPDCKMYLNLYIKTEKLD